MLQILRQLWGKTTITAPTTLCAIQVASQSTFINEDDWKLACIGAKLWGLFLG
jgi:hypothetical protein